MEGTVGLGGKNKQDYLTTFLCTQMTNVLILIVVVVDRLVCQNSICFNIFTFP